MRKTFSGKKYYVSIKTLQKLNKITTKQISFGLGESENGSRRNHKNKQ